MAKKVYEIDSITLELAIDKIMNIGKRLKIALNKSPEEMKALVNDCAISLFRLKKQLLDYVS